MSAARWPFDLAGPTALATGGNQGLGMAFAIGPAEAGARVAIAGRSEGRNQKVTAEAAGSGHTLHHHGLGARGRWGAHRMVSSTAPGVNRRVVVNALDDVIVEAVPDRPGLRPHRECHV